MDFCQPLIHLGKKSYYLLKAYGPSIIIGYKLSLILSTTMKVGNIIHIYRLEGKWYTRKSSE